MSLTNDLLSEHGSELKQAMTSQIGVDENQATTAINTIAPLVLNGLKMQKDANGEGAVSDLLSKFGGSEDLLGNISGLLGGGGQGGTGHILQSLLGGSKEEAVATNALSQTLGVNGGQVQSMISMIVPVVMGFLAKKGRVDPNTPDTQSGIASLLDRDGDGSAIDDLASMIFSAKGGNSAAGGMLGSIVGGFLKGK